MLPVFTAEKTIAADNARDSQQRLEALLAEFWDGKACKFTLTPDDCLGTPKSGAWRPEDAAGDVASFVDRIWLEVMPSATDDEIDFGLQWISEASIGKQDGRVMVGLTNNAGCRFVMSIEPLV